MLVERPTPARDDWIGLDFDPVGEPPSVGPCALVQPAEVTVVVPTYNEASNLEEVVFRVGRALSGVEWEIVFVDDDSPDLTAEKARDLNHHNGRVRVVQRIGRRGLSSACIEGMLASSAPILVVMDGDLQHDADLLTTMVKILGRDRADLVVASRYCTGGGTGEWTQNRVGLSRAATWLTRNVLGVPLTDPMSGYFALKRSVLDDTVRDLSGIGFKILLDIVLSAPMSLRIKELPFQFGVRHSGESKLSPRVIWELGLLVADKLVGRFVPIRFIAFGCVGGLGLIVHFCVLKAAMTFQQPFVAAQAIATTTAIVANYAVNNELTYRDRTRRGWSWFKGLLSFGLVCGVGAAANVGVAAYLFDHHAPWSFAAIAGVLAGAVWNYAASARYTWSAGR